MDKKLGRENFPTEREYRFQERRTRLFDRMRQLGSISDNYRPTFAELTREYVWEARKALNIWERKLKIYTSEEAAPTYHIIHGFNIELDQAENKLQRLIRDSEPKEADGVPSHPESQTTLF